jgi:hypothetical protein
MLAKQAPTTGHRSRSSGAVDVRPVSVLQPTISVQALRGIGGADLRFLPQRCDLGGELVARVAAIGGVKIGRMTAPDRPR